MHGGNTASPAGAREANREIPSTSTTNNHQYHQYRTWMRIVLRLVEGHRITVYGIWVTFNHDSSPFSMTQGTATIDPQSITGFVRAAMEAQTFEKPQSQPRPNWIPMRHPPGRSPKGQRLNYQPSSLPTQYVSLSSLPSSPFHKSQLIVIARLGSETVLSR